MVLQGTDPQQNDAPNPIVTKNKTLFLIIATALLVGVAMFLWQQYSINSIREEFKAQLESSSIESKNLMQQNIILTEEKNKAVAERDDIAKKTCKGTWQNGVCVQSTCVDSDINEKPEDIYIKGSVTFTDANGVATNLYDECSGSKLQVNEKWCYESPSGSGNYVQGNLVYDCPSGCFDGSCVK